MADTMTEPVEVVAFWIAELRAARKRDAEYTKNGKRILDLYDGTLADETPFNILFSNTETMQPALYSATPRPVVERRFKDADPIGKSAAEAGRRCLEFLIDPNLSEYDSYDATMGAVTLDALLPGRGWATVKYDAVMQEMEQDESKESAPYVQYETACVEPRQWNRVFHGYAKRWRKVPWVAYEVFMDKREVRAKFGKAVADALTYSEAETREPDETKKTKEDRQLGERKVTCVYQIWDKDGIGPDKGKEKGTRKIRWISEQYPDGYLDVEDDPLGLSGFFNCPEPLQFVDKTHTLVPTALYTIYESQARELNELTRRIKHIVRAIKARGIYAGDKFAELSKLFEEDDAALIPAENASSLAFEKGVENAIWFMPIDQLIATLTQLYTAREAAKQVIYEITGISDILRGATKASETLGAQELKSQWGTLRLKNKQKEVARYAKDLLRLLLEIAASKFSEDTWAKMTGLPFTTTVQKQQAEALVMAAQASMQPPDPQAVAILKQPFWPDVLNVLKHDLTRAYRIDIETNSTVEPDAAEDHKNLTELFTVMSQTLSAIGPLVQSGVMPFQVAQQTLLFIARRYRYGSEMEDAINAMQPPMQEGQGEAQQKQLEQEKQAAMQEIQFKQKEAEMSLKEQAMQIELQQKQREMDLTKQEMELQMLLDKLTMMQQQSQMQAQQQQQQLQMKTQGAKNQLNMQHQQNQFKSQQQHMKQKQQLAGAGAR